MNREWKLFLIIGLITMFGMVMTCSGMQVSMPSTITSVQDSSTYTVTSNDWPQTNYDATMSRNSPQTVIGKNNVDQLQVKWILNTNYPIEAPPLIVGDTAYVTNNACWVMAVDLATGLNKWKYDPGVAYTGGELPRASSSHGLTYEDGVIYAPTGPNGTIVALDASNGNVIWISPLTGPQGPAFRQPAPPLIWNDIIVAGSALGDEPPFGIAQKGTVTGLDKKTGKILWQTPLAVGAWVTTSPNATQNGGATVWTGGAVDMETGIVYLPVGNPSPDFQPDVRSPGPNKYTNSIIAVNITDGKILWDTPFVADGTFLTWPMSLPDGHDYDCSWGTNLVKMQTPYGTTKVVIGHDKAGDVAALNAATGKPIWWVNLIFLLNTNQNPTPTGTDVVFPGPAEGIEAFTATDGTKVYAAASNQPVYYYSEPSPGYVKPAFDAIPNGYSNGSVNAIDLGTGRVVWTYPTEEGTWVSPLVTNGIVFSGHITDTGKPYPYSAFGGPTDTPIISSGILMAFDADTGRKLWEFNLGAQAAIGGPSIGNGYLLVGTGSTIQTPNTGGYVVAFGLPGS